MAKKLWLKELCEQEGITASAIRETTGLSFDAIRNKMKNPYKYFTLKQLTEFYSLFDKEKYKYGWFLSQIIGNKYEGKERKWFDLEDDEYLSE